ncbi:hypothetical protein ERO13_A05G133101v2 [Gossypium hirsutum]|nr:hypothetical protein ERO13_A05G133101v2 [Gossypium hirsutum]
MDNMIRQLFCSMFSMVSSSEASAQQFYVKTN